MLHTLIIPAVVASFLSPTAGNTICSQLDSEPTVGGVVEVVVDLLSQGYDSETGSELLVTTVQSQCPEYIPLLVKFAQKYG